MQLIFYKHFEKGQILQFGKYFHSDLVYLEPIDWIVLDVVSDKVLIISKFALDLIPYTIEGEQVTWESSNLRKWLNDDFYNTAFTEQDKELIILSHIVNIDNPCSDELFATSGNDTEDNVFVLNIQEVEHYFDNDEQRICQPSPYASSKGIGVNMNDRCCWWLRSSGFFQDLVANVDYSGYVYYKGDYTFCSPVAVRPSMWVKSQ